MTETLDMAVARLAALPSEEQDRIAGWLLEELQDEKLWDQQFSKSKHILKKLATEARDERTAGSTIEIKPDKL
jgi:hypothetical protein